MKIVIDKKTGEIDVGVGPGDRPDAVLSYLRNLAEVSEEVEFLIRKAIASGVEFWLHEAVRGPCAFFGAAQEVEEKHKRRVK